MANPYPGTAAPPHHQPATGGAPVPDSYFTESRKGEINELKNLLREFGTERDPQRKRDIIKKVRMKEPCRHFVVLTISLLSFAIFLQFK